MATKTPYQVQKSGDNRIYEVKAETFEELVVEGRKRLGLGEEEIEEITLAGDKKVDRDNFQSLNPNTVLIFKFRYGEHTLNNLFKRLEECKPDILIDYLKNHPEIVKLIQTRLEGIGGNMAEDRKDDDKWFKDVDVKYQTKCHFMRFKAETRTKNYFSDTRKKLLKNSNEDGEMKQKKRDVIKKFSSKLKENSYYDKRFDRFADGRLCNENGEFDCQGAHNEKSCGFKHHINPYLRKEYLIEFSSWNLDHQIEKGREVLPQLEIAIEDPSREVNWVYFYDILFTMENLKLVHPVCHDKKDHERKVNMTKVFLPVPYRVQSSGATRRYGVMAGTFEKLKANGCTRLGLQAAKIEEITLEDDTIVNSDNFHSLDPNTLLIFKSRSIEDIVKDLVENHEALSKFPLDIVTNCLGTHPNRRVANALQSYIDALTYDNEAEARGDDAEWFKGVPERFQNKSCYMRFKAKARTRKYFNETKYRLLHSDANDDPEMRERKNEVINNFESKLKENRWYDKRFDRTADGNQKLCNNDGKFNCQGAYNRDSCPHSHHHINPYLRKDYLIEFSSWNLDHQIEKGREVWPILEKAAEDPLRRVDWYYFYGLLFTMEYLKLVHTACHDKMGHQLKVDMTKVYLPV